MSRRAGNGRSNGEKEQRCVCAFSRRSHNDDGEELAAFFALGNVAADGADGKRNFRDEDDVSAAGDARLERNPAAVTAHDLNHHHAMVRRRGSVNLVHGVGDGVKRGIKAERDLSGG